MLQSRIFNVTNMSFNNIRENITLTKISEFTVNMHSCVDTSMLVPYSNRPSTGLQIRVGNWKLFFLFLDQNICCGYSKEPSQ